MIEIILVVFAALLNLIAGIGMAGLQHLTTVRGSLFIVAGMMWATAWYIGRNSSTETKELIAVALLSSGMAIPVFMGVL